MEEQKRINLVTERDFSENFDLALTFIKQNYGAILKPICIFIPIFLIAIYLIPNTQNVSMSSMAAYDNPIDMYKSLFPIGAIIAYFITGISMYLTILYTITYMATYAKSTDGIVKSSDIWNRVKKVMIPLFLGSILFSLLVGIGTIFCIIPGIIIYVYLGFYMYTYINEDLGIIDSFQRSFNLVKNNWWVTFGFGLIFGILFFIVSMIFSIPSYIAILGPTLDIEFLKSDIYMYVATLISSLGSFLLYPLLYMAMGILYYSHVAKLDGTDMDSEIENIGTYENGDDKPRY
ncbi:EI24 domain-containing protein [Dysgonomonas sp. BGC7]|uniref:EI24 domain-containing protein n=1 Tax=Dysgonomonas sp. BGC7 TaxID=1658008 RepID=UPI000681008B|nr:EI24 domain-containing protein [Dysgonomonas sp. BGC7]MBD8388045.1 EI24 domain-containing protein [Dysgonomonas sp. BGC7]